MKPTLVVSNWLATQTQNVGIRIYDVSQQRNETSIISSYHCSLKHFEKSVLDKKYYVELIKKFGFNSQCQSVLYAEQEADCYRVLFVLNFYGFEKVSVLQFGFKGWQDGGFPVQTKYANPVSASNPLYSFRSRLMFQNELEVGEEHQQMLADEGGIEPKKFFPGLKHFYEPLLIRAVLRENGALLDEKTLVFAGKWKYYLYFLCALAEVKCGIVE